MSVRVRFAPSPTGSLHIGGLRTALYNYLFAKHNNGACILRIEDTDRTRLVADAAENLISSLKWAGIEFDESPVAGGEFGPYVQSERLDIYKKYVQILLENRTAYYAFDTSEEIEAMRARLKEAGADPKYDRNSMRNQLTIGDEETNKLLALNTPYVIRLAVPDKEVKFTDIIRGEVIIHGRDIDDQVLLKSDGFPTYHLANVLDDYLMKISHVIRGEEWLPSTPKHVLLYEAFGWEMPQFAHLPLLLNPDKSKLSKRQGSVSVEEFIFEGYFREALVNFVALLGWNPTADREIFSMQELIDSFNLEKVNKGGAVFDKTKLEWMNFQYMKSIDENELAVRLMPTLEQKGYNYFDITYISKVIVLLRERVKFLHEIPDFGSYMFSAPKEFDSDYKNKYWTDDTQVLLQGLLAEYKSMNEFSHDSINEVTKKYVEDKGLKLKQIIHPVRLIITGVSAGAGMFETMEVLGKDECIKRFEYFLEHHS